MCQKNYSLSTFIRGVENLDATFRSKNCSTIKMTEILQIEAALNTSGLVWFKFIPGTFKLWSWYNQQQVIMSISRVNIYCKLIALARIYHIYIMNLLLTNVGIDRLNSCMHAAIAQLKIADATQRYSGILALHANATIEQNSHIIIDTPKKFIWSHWRKK